MSMKATTWRSIIDGEAVEVPATIDGIRSALDTGEAAEFDAQIAHTPASELPMVLARWALAGTRAAEIDEEMFARLAAGDFAGCVPDEQGPGAA